MHGIPAGEWLLSVPDEVPALWGSGDQVAWAAGETAMIYGSDGSGKGVLAQNLALRQAGIIEGDFLGLPVAPRERILYVAQDRPAQIRRSFRRMIGEVDRETLDSKILVVDQPLPRLLDEEPEQLADLAATNEADTVIVDSVKDVIAQPSTEESGLAMRRAYALCLAEGIEVMLLHHDRKKAQLASRAALALDDVYGSRFMVGGCGSVIALNGRSGDPVVGFRQLKQPAAEVGPFRIRYDFTTGAAVVNSGSDLLSILKASKGLSVGDAARQLYDTEAPTRAEQERTRRQLKSLVGSGLAHEKASPGPPEPAMYYPVEVFTEPFTQGGSE